MVIKDNKDKKNNRKQKNHNYKELVNNKNQLLKKKDNQEEEGQDKVNNDHIFKSFLIDILIICL